MKKKKTYHLEFKLFFRGSVAWVGILILLLTGFAGLYFGKTFIDNQEKVIEKAAQLQKKNTKLNIQHFGEDVGLVFFHNKFAVANVPDQWSAFAIGQRDINPYLISVTMLALEGQLYDTDISNPVSLLLGNMDLSFVFIFLFPLIIIAFNYNVVSEQKENGVWPILRSQTDQLFSVIYQKFMVRILTVFAVAVILMIAAIFYLQLPIDVNLLAISSLIFLYLAFWFATSFFFISLAKSSSYNASALIGLWVILCIVVPASLNLILTKKFPVPEALQNVINQREGYHEKWDMPKEATMNPFFEHYPQLKKYPFPEHLTFSWYWYFAMQQMGDDQATASRLAIDRKLASRQYFTNLMALFFPTIQTQLGINEMACSDLGAHLEFQQAVRKYHEHIRLNFYPAIFSNQNIASTNLESYGLKTFKSSKIYNSQRLLSMAVITSILIAFFLINFRKLSKLN